MHDKNKNTTTTNFNFPRKLAIIQAAAIQVLIFFVIVYDLFSVRPICECVCA